MKLETLIYKIDNEWANPVEMESIFSDLKHIYVSDREKMEFIQRLFDIFVSKMFDYVDLFHEYELEVIPEEFKMGAINMLMEALPHTNLHTVLKSFYDYKLERG